MIPFYCCISISNTSGKYARQGPINFNLDWSLMGTFSKSIAKIDTKKKLFLEYSYKTFLEEKVILHEHGHGE
jgi:hypothetical protein